MEEPKKKSSWGLTGSECEGCVYIAAGIIIGCLVIGFIVWQLLMLGQLVGVMIGLVTFSALLISLILYFWISGRGDNPSLAFKLKVTATIFFVVFLVEAIFTFRFFWTPIFYPIISSLFAQANWGMDTGLIMIVVVGFFIVIIAAYFSIPVCLWTSICRSSKEAPEITPVPAPLVEKKEKAHFPEKCPACGMKLKGNEKFCGNCGVAIDTD